MVTSKVTQKGIERICYFDSEKKDWFWKDTNEPVENLELLNIDLWNEIMAIRHIRANTEREKVTPDYYRMLSNAATKLEEAGFWLNEAMKKFKIDKLDFSR